MPDYKKEYHNLARAQIKACAVLEHALQEARAAIEKDGEEEEPDVKIDDEHLKEVADMVFAFPEMQRTITVGFINLLHQLQETHDVVVGFVLHTVKAYTEALTEKE